MRKVLLQGLTALAIAAAAGHMACGVDPEPDCEGEECELIDSAPQAQSATDIGVIPETACASGADSVVIFMDDEDDDNSNSKQGWYGAIVSTSNTELRFCRTDGSKFKPHGTSGAANEYYAVLKLGTNCPNGSVTISRYFDNEDDDNSNTSSGNIAPNVSNRNTRLFFCLFKPGLPGAPNMASFPDIQGLASYGVLAASDFPGALGTGKVHTDDEDDDNSNTFSAPIEVQPFARRIIVPGTNTTLNLARVK